MTAAGTLTTVGEAHGEAGAPTPLPTATPPAAVVAPSSAAGELSTVAGKMERVPRRHPPAAHGERPPMAAGEHPRAARGATQRSAAGVPTALVDAPGAAVRVRRTAAGTVALAARATAMTAQLPLPSATRSKTIRGPARMAVEMVHRSAQPAQRGSPLPRTKTDPQAATAPPSTATDQTPMAMAARLRTKAPQKRQVSLSDVWPPHETPPPTPWAPQPRGKTLTTRARLPPTRTGASAGDAPPQPP